jgi:hypothetical protein
MTVALVALFVALGGTATAAKLLITSAQIKDGTVQKADLHANSVDSSKVVNNSLTLKDFDSASRAAMSGGKALEAFRTDGPEAQPDGTPQDIATLHDIPAGAYVFIAKTNLSAPSAGGLLQTGQSVSGSCRLVVGDNSDETFHLIGAWAGNAPAGFNMQMTQTVPSSGANAKVNCTVTGADWRASNTQIIAIPVAGISLTSVTG